MRAYLPACLSVCPDFPLQCNNSRDNWVYAFMRQCKNWNILIVLDSVLIICSYQSVLKLLYG